MLNDCLVSESVEIAIGSGFLIRTQGLFWIAKTPHPEVWSDAYKHAPLLG